MGVGNEPVSGKLMDCGATGTLQGGAAIYEADIVLTICKSVRGLLQDDFEVKLSREIGEHQKLSEKTSMSNSWRADLFVSVHNNSYTSDASGDEVLYKTANGKIIANLINEEIKKQIPENRNRGLKKRDNLYVLNQSAAIAALVECGFLSTQADFLNDKNNLDRYALAIANGIRAYYSMPEIKKKVKKLNWLEKFFKLFTK